MKADLRTAIAAALLCGAAALPHASSWAQTTPGSASAAGTAGAAASTPARPPAPEALREREALLTEGEAALRRLDALAAQSAFGRAAQITHAADTEMGLVRSYMQAGQYRRALAFGAHTAGAHLDVIGGTALYAWLLHAGGQQAVAGRLLQEALARAPGQPLASRVQTQLQSPSPRAAGPMLAAPARLAPYGDGAGLPRSAQVTASATLVRGGAAALLPQRALVPGARYWVRNGLGQLARAQLLPGPARHGLVLAQLQPALKPLPPPFGPSDAAAQAAPRDAFPGSPAFALHYVADPQATPAWPLLSASFLGAPLATNTANRQLDMAPQPQQALGGPVYDQAGRIIGVALGEGRDSAQPAQLIAASQLRQAFPGPALWPQAEPGPAPAPRQSVDAIYEAGLLHSAQLLRSR